ncbi:hypothetical protein KUTeg_018994 [Tegillarca granosa]|uniref:Uncharacterized protein n=1 Tax=Tegillarca granosa TaxID=220873 RepID=A0ABQ9EB85_TEGGR|nr:hypothetical protein KUTeg_018994 [Tegillarca granosa]
MNNAMHFGMRSREEHANLRWGDVELKGTATGGRYLEFTERAQRLAMGLLEELELSHLKCMKTKETQDVQFQCTCVIQRRDQKV